MADIDVQPKQRSSNWWLWLLLALLLLFVLIYFVRSCNKSITTAAATADSSVTVTGVTTPPSVNSANAGSGDDTGMSNVPAASYNEITGSNISVRGNDKYGIYSLGENVLFDEGKSTIRPNAESNLKQIAASIQKRFAGGDVRIFGYTDSIGSSSANKQLAEQRAEAVRTWLSSNGLSADHLSVNAVGDAKAVATNATASGRQQNRRVEIVARKAQ